LTKLTAKQEAFAQEIAAGKSQIEAYRLVYNAENMRERTQHREATALMKNHKITTRVSELKKDLEMAQLWTREMSVQTLVNILKSGGHSHAISAVQELNRMHGYHAPTVSEVDMKLTVETGVPDRGAD